MPDADARRAARRRIADAFPIDPDLEPSDRAEPSATHRPAAGPAHRAHPATLAAVFVGGLCGTLGRYELGLALPTARGHFPAATFLVNVTGAFVLGLFLTVLLERFGPTRFARPFLATGVLGGWTTYSSLAVDVTSLGRSGHPVLAVGYVLATLAAGLGAAMLGIMLGRRRFPRTGSLLVRMGRAVADRAPEATGAEVDR